MIGHSPDRTTPGTGLLLARDTGMGHFVDHLSRAECVKTCTRHNDRLERRLSAFDDAGMGHFVDHLSRAECVKTCTRHNDRLGLRHQQRGRQRRQDGVCVTVGALTT